jgi:hypothetical protein
MGKKSCYKENKLHHFDHHTTMTSNTMFELTTMNTKPNQTKPRQQRNMERAKGQVKKTKPNSCFMTTS